MARLELVLDCNDPERLAPFWAGALGYEIKGSRGAYTLLRPKNTRDPSLLLQRVPEGKTVKNRMHLDIKSGDIESEASRLEGMGAKRLDVIRTTDEHWIVMADPEGNEFCVCWTGPLSITIGPLTVEVANGTEEELHVRRILERMLSRYDASRWYFTDHVVIDENAPYAHSHPVLTLRTLFSVRNSLGVLTTFIHEQLHWYLVSKEAETEAAIADLRALYPNVPGGEAEGGAREEASTYCTWS